MAMAREEFESWESDNYKFEDLEPDEQQVSEGGKGGTAGTWPPQGMPPGDPGG